MKSNILILSLLLSLSCASTEFKSYIPVDIPRSCIESSIQVTRVEDKAQVDLVEGEAIVDCPSDGVFIDFETYQNMKESVESAKIK